MKIENELYDEINAYIDSMKEYNAIEMIDQRDIDTVLLDSELVACNMFVGYKNDFLLERRDYDSCKSLIMILTHNQLNERELKELLDRTGLMDTENIIGVYTSEKYPEDLCKLLTIVTK